MAHLVTLQVIRVKAYQVGPSWNREERIDRTVTQKNEFSAKTKAAAMSKAMRWARSGWDLDLEFSKVEKRHLFEQHSFINLYE